MRLEASIQEIKGIGEKTKQLFAKIGVYTAGDILLHFPRTYQQFPEPLERQRERGRARVPSAVSCARFRWCAVENEWRLPWPPLTARRRSLWN